MIIRYLKIVFLIASALLLLTPLSRAENATDEQHIKVAMRTVGHEFLLNICDSTSRVLPIEKVGDRYKIQFETDFQFDPVSLETAVDRVLGKSRIGDHYFVEVEPCDSTIVAYSYEGGNTYVSNEIPCRGRPLPKDCYSFFISILAPVQPMLVNNDLSIGAVRINSFFGILLIITLFILIALFVYSWNQRLKATSDLHKISIGDYQFDKRNMELSFENNTIELTSKEADLLTLLHTSANNTLEREVILKNVWGGDGDYVGRTLDVFISKLRKKLEGDSSVKIVNVRGVGYKLIINN